MKDFKTDQLEMQFISHYVQNASQIAWFLGAGTSRAAGMPTANDITWDLKRRYYCLHENQDIKYHDLNNSAVTKRIQNYLDSKGFPALWSAEEYSFYFDLTFGDDYASQQKYLAAQLSSSKISLNIGHRALAALIELGLTKMVFTTNFDEVLETAFATVADKSLSAYHLEGSYAALEALNSEHFPIYAKLHGDFRYQSIKNIAADLRDNDRQIEKCFLAAGNRFGMVVSGYSGRDANVMAMFRSTLEQANPFPLGLFWTTTDLSSVSDSVRDLVAYAHAKGVRSEIFETGTFDIMMSKIWRQIQCQNVRLNAKVRSARANSVCIPLPQRGVRYPILRTNALQICKLPTACGWLECQPAVGFCELNEILRNSRPDAIVTSLVKILFWGNSNELIPLFDANRVKSVSLFPLLEVARSGSDSTILQSFFEQALAEAVCSDKPLLLRKKGRSYFAVVNHQANEDPRLDPLKEAVGFQGKYENVVGLVPRSESTFWAEALELKIDRQDGKWWLLVNPDIWISPLSKREESIDFVIAKKLKRYNSQAFKILSAWIQLICGSIGSGETVAVCYKENTEFPARFELSTRTAYSRLGGLNE